MHFDIMNVLSIVSWHIYINRMLLFNRVKRRHEHTDRYRIGQVTGGSLLNFYIGEIGSVKAATELV